MLTDEQLKAMRERCEKAANGPWEVVGPDLGNDQPGHWCMPIRQAGDAGYHTPAHCYGSNRPGNAHFVAAARTDIPLLLDEVERLKDELEESERCLRESTVG